MTFDKDAFIRSWVLLIGLSISMSVIIIIGIVSLGVGLVIVQHMGVDVSGCY